MTSTVLKCSRSVRGGKAFVAEQKIRAVKSRITKLSALKMNVLPTAIVLQSVEIRIILKAKSTVLTPMRLNKNYSQVKSLEPFSISIGQNGKKNMIDLTDMTKINAAKINQHLVNKFHKTSGSEYFLFQQKRNIYNKKETKN